MTIGRSLTNLNGYVKNTLMKESKEKRVVTVPIEELKRILSIRLDKELQFFILDTNLTEFKISWSDQLVTVDNVELLQSRVNNKLKLYYSFDENDLLEVESKSLSKEKKRETLFKQKTLLQKIYNQSGLTKEDLQQKLYPNRFIESGLISKEDHDDIEKIILDDLAKLSSHSIYHQGVADFLRKIILNKNDLVLIQKKGKDPQEYVYLSTLSTTLGSYADPFKQNEQVDQDLYNTTIYLMDSNGEEMVICGLLSYFIFDYAFFEGNVPYRLDPDKLVEYFHLENGLDSISVQFLSYDNLFNQGEKRSRQLLNNFGKFDWFVNSYKKDIEIANRIIVKLSVTVPEWDVEKADKYFEAFEDGTLNIPSSFIQSLDPDVAKDPDLVNRSILNFLTELQKSVKDRNFCMKILKFLS